MELFQAFQYDFLRVSCKRENNEHFIHTENCPRVYTQKSPAPLVDITLLRREYQIQTRLLIWSPITVTEKKKENFTNSAGMRGSLPRTFKSPYNWEQESKIEPFTLREVPQSSHYHLSRAIESLHAREMHTIITNKCQQNCTTLFRV